MNNHRDNSIFKETGCRMVLIAEPVVRNGNVSVHQGEDGFAIKSLPVLLEGVIPPTEKTESISWAIQRHHMESPLSQVGIWKNQGNECGGIAVALKAHAGVVVALKKP
jgi:hypothetical protein